MADGVEPPEDDDDVQKVTPDLVTMRHIRTGHRELRIARDRMGQLGNGITRRLNVVLALLDEIMGRADYDE